MLVKVVVHNSYNNTAASMGGSVSTHRDDVERACRDMRRLQSREGNLRRMRENSHYVKPSEKRNRKKNERDRRIARSNFKAMERDGICSSSAPKRQKKIRRKGGVYRSSTV